MKIFAGVDLASESVEMFVQDESGRQVQRGGMSWAPGRWKSWVEKHGAENLVVAFECGPEAYRAKAILDPLGVEIYPFHAKNFGGRRKKKTDKIDAKKISKRLRGQALPERVVLAEPPVAKLRNLISERQLFLKLHVQMNNRVRGLSRQWGVSLPKYRRDIATQWWSEVVECFAPAQQEQIRRLCCQALACLQTSEQLDEEIAQQLECSELSEAAQRLQSVPGVGPVVASGLIAYLENGQRFTSGRKFASYLGLVPSVEQTGKSPAKLGHITKEGPGAVRWLLVQAANAAVGGHQLDRTRWRKWFDRLAQRRGRKIAIVALARKLAILCYAVIRDGTEWEPDRLRRTG